MRGETTTQLYLLSCVSKKGAFVITVRPYYIKGSKNDKTRK